MLRLPILASPLRGYWWLPASRGKVLRILRGAYEQEQTAHFVRWVRPGAIVIDVGAHVGYYTLLASILAGDTGKVWALEPEPRNAAYLRRHMSINHRENVHVEEVAVSDKVGTAHFTHGTGSGTGHLDSAGSMQVDTVSLTDFCKSRGIVPSALKIDVEGAEVPVLEGAMEMLQGASPVIFLSTHGADLHRRCLELLGGIGYTFLHIYDDAGINAEILCLPAGVSA